MTLSAKCESKNMKWNSSLYDQKHSFVFKYGEEVLALLNPKRGERILDVGCGTGHLTKLIAEMGAEVVGIDSSPEMIEAARTAWPDINFVLADAADFSFTEPFDAVFSNAALHWVTEAERAVVCMAQSVKQGGRVVVELGGKGNIAAITTAVREAIWEVLDVKVEHGRYYPSVSEYSGLLERHGLFVRRAVPTPARLLDQVRGKLCLQHYTIRTGHGCLPHGRLTAGSMLAQAYTRRG